MSRLFKKLVNCVSTSVICSFGIMAYGSGNTNPPNILLFLADDMTWRDCEPYGNPDVMTPNIQRLAREGMRFDNMHTSTAMSAPTRQQLYTGLYPVRSGAYPNHSMVYSGVKSVVHHFGELGYRVGLVGKVHHDPVSSFPFEFIGGRPHDNGSGTDIHIERIKPLLNQDGNPFFLVISCNQPHTPWNRGPVHLYDEDTFTIPDYMVDCKETRADLKRYYAEITYADSLLGVALDYLEESGKVDNTIVIFTSEQGSSFPFAKWTLYDLGLKTAFIVRWPGKIQPGSHNDALTQYVDVIPTLLEAAGATTENINTGIADANGYNGFDGKSFLDVMLGNQGEHRDYVYGIHTTRGIHSGSVCYPIRSVRSRQYKYIINLNNSSPFFNTVNTRSNGIYLAWIDATANDPDKRAFIMRYTYRPKEELYDVINDPYEKNNLATKPDFASVKKLIINELEFWMTVQGDKGIDTEMNALSRMPQTKEPTWHGHEEQLNRRIFEKKP